MSLNPFKLEEYLGKYEFSAQYLLCCSDAESYQMSDILALASPKEKQLWENLSLGYTEVAGLPMLREVVSDTLYEGLGSDHILMFAGAQEGIFCALSSIISKEDHVIVLTPCYQSLLEVPRSKGAQISEIELKADNEWRIDLEAIKRAVRPNTQCIIINFPHNPTGQVIEAKELEELIGICEKNGIWIFSDEVYRLLGTPQNPWSKPAALCYDKAISLGVMSKAFGMPGLRVGWIACQDKKILKSIERMKHYTSICNSAPAEILSLISLSNKDKILARNNQIVARNLNILDQFFVEHAHLFEWVRPQGGCVGFVEYKGEQSVDTFCVQLVQKRSTLLMPASIYDHQGNYFRIGFGRENMPKALGQLQTFLNS